MSLLGNILIWIGLIFMAFGIFGTYRFKNFYSRILVSSKIDIIGDITIIVGLVLKHGMTFFSAKLILLVVILVVINPLSSHMIVRSAYTSGYKVRKDER